MSAAPCPTRGADLAKLLFRSFMSGFSERLAPQIIGKAGQGRAGAAASVSAQPRT